MKMKIKKVSLVILILLFAGAGINHFWHPEFYMAIMPPYISDHHLANILAGVSEISLGILMIFRKTREFAAYTIIAMLILFVPVHIYMIQKGGCMNELVCIPSWQAWLRLTLQPLLIFWVWWHRK